MVHWGFFWQKLLSFTKQKKKEDLFYRISNLEIIGNSRANNGNRAKKLKANRFFTLVFGRSISTGSLYISPSVKEAKP
ncbi:unnamed protein product, partial [marine sediment metagenome]